MTRAASRRPQWRALALMLVVGAGACAPTDPRPSLVPTRPEPGTQSPPAQPGAIPEVTLLPVEPADVLAVPDPLPPGPPGAVIRAERVAAPAGAVAWRVLYHSRTIQGADTAVSGLIVAPDAPPPVGGFPVIAYAHGTTGLADSCAPSREARSLAPDGDPLGSLPLPPLWEAGYVVSATDYEGLGTPGRHPYLVGGSEGRSVLDGIRALSELPDVATANRAVVIGVSQGGHAALFSGELAAVYAPDVELIGIVALAPAAELAQAAMLLTGDESVVGFGVAIGAGLAAAYPEAGIENVLTDRALAALDVVDRGCIDEVLATFAGPVEDTVRLERLALPPWPRLLEENSPGRGPSVAPILVGQGEADALVVPALTDALVTRLCLLGDDVTYRQYPGASHGSILEAARDDVLRWISDRTGGSPAGRTGGDCPG